MKNCAAVHINWGQCELCCLPVSYLAWWRTNWSHCFHSDPPPSSFSSYWVTLTPELASLRRFHSSSPIHSVSNVFNHFSSVGSLWFPFGLFFCSFVCFLDIFFVHQGFFCTITIILSNSPDYCSVLLRAKHVSITSRKCVKMLSIKLSFK